MRKSLFVLIAAMMVATTVPAFAELQNVEVGGDIRIRGNWYDTVEDFNSDAPDQFVIEQRTKLNVKADFTDDVTAFIELDSYNNWGDDSFRRLDVAQEGIYGSSDRYAPSPTSFGVSGTPVNLYQAYIEMNDAWGYPITLRLGRSEMQHGSEFLVGNQDTSSSFTGLSFDGAWLTYTHDQFWIQGFWTRIAQNDSFRWEQNGDVDFMGLYGSYTGIEDMTIDAYYYLLSQDATDLNGLTESSGLHTVGARFAGNKSQFDWELNGAYQFGTGDENIVDPVSASLVDQSAFGVQGSLGYTFDIEYQPRVFAHGGYYSSDTDDGSFNRLFSDHEYSEFLDSGNLTGVWFVGGGAGAQVTESIGLTAVVTYFQNDEDTAAGQVGIENIGVELGTYMTYNYSEDLAFNLGYAHFFPTGDTDDAGGDHMNYAFFETSISF